MTSHNQPPRSLSSQAMSGGRWGATRSLALQLGTLVTTGILTRILGSDEFGLVAISVTVLTMFDLLTRVGFGASVIRRIELDQVSASTLFWAAVALGTLAGALAAAVAEPMATLAGASEAAHLVRVSAVALPMGLATSVLSGLMYRDLRFKASSLVEISLTVVYGVLAVWLATLGWGAMAIVVAQVVRTAGALIVLFVLTGFRPSFVFSRSVIREDLAFSLGVLGGDIVSYANRNIDYWWVGNRMGKGPLGVYYVAFVIPNLLRQRFNAIGHEVLYPVVSKFQDDIPRIGAAYLRVMRLVSFLVLPTMLGLISVADLAIPIGFGPGWEGAVVPLDVIAGASAITALGVIARPIFVAIGRPRITVVSGVASLVVMLTGFVIMDEMTLVGVAWATAAGAVTEVLVAQVYVVRLLRVPLSEQVLAVGPFVISSLVMICAVLATRLLIDGSMTMVPEAVLSVAVGIVSYFVVGMLIFRAPFKEQLAAVRRFLGLG